MSFYSKYICSSLICTTNYLFIFRQNKVEFFNWNCYFPHLEIVECHNLFLLASHCWQSKNKIIITSVVFIKNQACFNYWNNLCNCYYKARVSNVIYHFIWKLFIHHYTTVKVSWYNRIPLTTKAHNYISISWPLPRGF